MPDLAPGVGVSIVKVASQDLIRISFDPAAAAAAGSIYPTTAAGIADTVDGEYFFVAEEDGEALTLYLNESEVATETGIELLTIAGAEAVLQPIADDAEASATLAGHYANDDTDVDVPGGAAGERGAKYWSTFMGLVAQLFQMTSGDDAPYEDRFYLADIWTGVRKWRLGIDGTTRDELGNRFVSEADINIDLLGQYQLREGVVDADDVPVMVVEVDIWTGVHVRSLNQQGVEFVFSEDAPAADPFEGVIVEFDPTFSESGGARDYRVRVLSWTEAGPEGYLEEINIVRSGHADAPGAWRLLEVWKCELVSAALATVNRLEMTTGSQVSGGIMFNEGANLSGMSIDNGEEVHNDSPYGPIGGADIHRNNAGVSVMFRIDGLPITLPAVAKEIHAGLNFRMDHTWEGVRPRDPSEITTADPVVLGADILEVKGDGRLTMQSWGTAQEEFTCSMYTHIWCHNALAANDVFTHVRRPFHRSASSAAPFTGVEEIAIADYDEASYPGGDDDIPSVPWLEYRHHTKGTLVRQEWTAPVIHPVDWDNWSEPTLGANAITQIKPSNGKVYQTYAPPDGAVTVGDNTFGVLQPGDTVYRTTTLTHSFPRSA